MRRKTPIDGRLVLLGKSGYIFPMILFASLAVGLFVITLTQFQTSNRMKYRHLNDYQAAFNIGYSALVDVLADIQSRQWNNRTFKSGPQNKNASLYGGTYNLRVEDHSAGNYVFNVKIRVSYKEKTHLFYWRMIYNPSLLDFTNLFVPAYHEHSQDPAAIADPDSIDVKVDEIINQRKNNRPKVTQIAEALKPADTVKKALKVVGIDAGDVKNADEPRPVPGAITLPVAGLPLKQIAKLVDDVAPEANFVIKDLRFGGDEAELNADQKFLLDTLAELLNDRVGCKIELRGHTTDIVGTPEGNLEFSILRAQNVADYLVAAGVAANRISVRGFGQTQPIASNDTLEGQAKNRRVEFVLDESP
ncbi:MAG: hypothetical protein CVV41_05950 [Candidatus Riflebacteria bacterium HGW-Riflebacteria-1]|jgi:outer membrane protein OmpA-like peptidoglycan-associated protein|nr:MAG: hypothetical protein CVV41_05950 [Candidatus Riflebacteria bacterium HGW-Riflebacteria-1]